VGVDHGRAHVGVAEQFLDGADVVAGLEQHSLGCLTEQARGFGRGGRRADCWHNNPRQ
jgi:hypothetical protein